MFECVHGSGYTLFVRERTHRTRIGIFFLHSQVMGTHVLLETARRFQTQIKRFIHVSTDEVYGCSYDGDGKHIETDALEPTNPYAATKAAAEKLVKSYFHSYNLPARALHSRTNRGRGREGC